MAAPTRPTIPAPTTPAAALAAPCRNCQTTGGAIDFRLGRPRRAQGYCHACYARARNAGFPAVVPPAKHPGYGPYRPPIAHSCKHCGAGFLAYASDQRVYCSTPCRNADLYPDRPTPIPAGLSPILWPDRARPVWTGLALAKYPAPTWHTYRPRGRRLGEAA